MAVTIRTLDASHAALGIAPHVLARRAPFSGFRFGDLSQTVDDQIRRGHALFAFGERHIVGYLGWHLHDRADARLFAETGRPPPLDLPDGADVAWVRRRPRRSRRPSAPWWRPARHAMSADARWACATGRPANASSSTSGSHPAAPFRRFDRVGSKLNRAGFPEAPTLEGMEP
ncbi:hypothetical protein [Methylobacterium marchantiae]|uniref:Uncharacterized protein n=1 Tax=Methylobacterium marchantiae TaxID=600331 RepID=A0ABW3WW40_9HYPH|nr:hypothetical protein AIGOOFII_0840 [Methylobacterium marchantiae]